MRRKRILCMVLSILMVLLTLSIIPNASATITPANPGDADLNYKINIKDATLIQKFLAELVTPNGLQKAVAEVDGDGAVTVKDATMIQKYCAGIIDFFAVDLVFRDINAESLIVDYDSGKATTGDLVTFTVSAKGFGAPFYYQFFINDRAVTNLTEENTYTCTFDEVGFYDIEVHVQNDFGITDRIAIQDYEVVAPYESDTLVIKSFYHNKSPLRLYEGCRNTTFTAQAMFGSGCYEYAFYLDGETVQEYSADNTFTVDKFEEKGNHTLTVFIRDEQTKDVASQEMYLEIGEIAEG